MLSWPGARRAGKEGPRAGLALAWFPVARTQLGPGLKPGGSDPGERRQGTGTVMRWTLAVVVPSLYPARSSFTASLGNRHPVSQARGLWLEVQGLPGLGNLDPSAVPKLGVGVHGVPRGQESYLQSPAGLASCLPVNVLCSLHTLPHIHLPMSPRILAGDGVFLSQMGTGGSERPYRI